MPDDVLYARNVPPELRKRLLAFCEANSENGKRLEVHHLIELLDRILADPANIAFVNKQLTALLRERWPSLFMMNGPWRSRIHSVGFWGIWVRLPEPDGHQDPQEVKTNAPEPTS